MLNIKVVLTAVLALCVAMVIAPSAVAAIINGTSGNDDPLNGTPSVDTIDGKAGHDFILGKASRDHLYGGSGNDRIKGGPTPGDGDWAYGQLGDDVVYDVAWGIVTGGAGADWLNSGSGLAGDGGADIVAPTALSTHVVVEGGSGNDQLYTYHTNRWGNTVHGGDGYDTCWIGDDEVGLLIFSCEVVHLVGGSPSARSLGSISELGTEGARIIDVVTVEEANAEMRKSARAAAERVLPESADEQERLSLEEELLEGVGLG